MAWYDSLPFYDFHCLVTQVREIQGHLVWSSKIFRPPFSFIDLYIDKFEEKKWVENILVFLFDMKVIMIIENI